MEVLVFEYGIGENNIWALKREKYEPTIDTSGLRASSSATSSRNNNRAIVINRIVGE